MQATDPLARLYDEHAGALFAFLLQLTRNEADARDLLQEVFVKLTARPALLEDIRDVRAFLLRLAHNGFVDAIRRRGTRERNEIRFQAEQPQIFVPGADADESVFREALARALGELPEEQRVVVHLKLWEGWTFEAIADFLAVSVNTAASRYRYGIDKLRLQLRPLYRETQ